jgi:hypothetical protein
MFLLVVIPQNFGIFNLYYIIFKMLAHSNTHPRNGDSTIVFDFHNEFSSYHCNVNYKVEKSFEKSAKTSN